MTARIRWTKYADNLIRNSHSDSDVANKLGFSRTAIYRRRKELGLPRVGRWSVKEWTPEEDARLRDLCRQLMTQTEIAKALKRNLTVTNERMKKLGLKNAYWQGKKKRKSKSARLDEVTRLVRSDPSKRWKLATIGKHLGISRQAVSSLLKYYGLKLKEICNKSTPLAGDHPRRGIVKIKGKGE